MVHGQIKVTNIQRRLTWIILQAKWCCRKHHHRNEDSGALWWRHDVEDGLSAQLPLCGRKPLDSAHQASNAGASVFFISLTMMLNKWSSWRWHSSYYSWILCKARDAKYAYINIYIHIITIYKTAFCLLEYCQYCTWWRVVPKEAYVYLVCHWYENQIKLSYYYWMTDSTKPNTT